jgi:putative ABC transport system permease protein
VSDFLQDIGFAWRNALKKPATVLLIILTLALGIGVNTAMFSMAWHVLLAPLPYADADRLVKLEQNESANNQLNLAWSIPTFDEYNKLTDIFSALLQYECMPYAVLGADEPYLAQTGIVSGSYFAELGIQPLHGRTFIAEDDAVDAEPVMLLSHEFWASRLNADPDVIGRSLEVQSVSRRIIGVLPEIAPYPDANDIWITAANDPFRIYQGSDMTLDRDNRFPSYVFGRLRDDVSLADAAREVDLLAKRLAVAYPDFYAEDYTVALKTLREEMVANSRTSVVLLAGLAALVLLIVSANVANLNMARIAERSQELAVRESVGASPSRIMRQLLTENMLLALIGGLAGLAFAWPCLRLSSAFAAGYTPLASTVDIDASLLFVAFAIAVLTGIVSGTLSGFGKRDINSALKEGGDKVTSSSESVHRRHTLMFIQFALSFVALTVSALVVLSLYRLNGQNLGYDPDRILTLSTQVDVRPDEDFENLQQRTRFLITSILRETSAIPGVEAVAILGGDPLLESTRISSDFTSFDVEGLPSDLDAPFNATFNSATPGFFEMMGIALQSGQLFSDDDDENSIPVAIVNANFVEHFIPDGNALGKRIHIRGDPNWKTIIGVVANVSSAALDQPEPAAVYYNLQQRPAQPINVYVKSAADLGELGKVVSGVIHNIDPLQTLQNVKPLNAIKADWLAPSTLRAILITLLGLLALVLTLTGVIGVVSCNIHQRVREIGIHMAIGATPFNIVSMFITQGFKVYFVGLTFGLMLLLAGAPLIEPMLYEISVLNVGIYLLSAAVLTLAVLIAMYLPAKKASAMSPREALHAE